MKTLKIVIVGLAMMLAITGSASAQDGGNRGSDDVIDSDIITNAVDTETDTRDDSRLNSWPWQVSLNNVASDDTIPSDMTNESAMESGDRFFFTHSGSQ